MPKEKLDIVAAIEQASEADLQVIQKQIIELRKQLQSLEAIEKVLTVRLHGKPERKAREPKPAKAAGSEMANQIFDLITKRGPLSVQQIAQHFGSTAMGVAASIRHSGWFERDENGLYRIALAGRMRGNGQAKVTA